MRKGDSEEVRLRPQIFLNLARTETSKICHNYNRHFRPIFLLWSRERHLSFSYLNICSNKSPAVYQGEILQYKPGSVV